MAKAKVEAKEEVKNKQEVKEHDDFDPEKLPDPKEIEKDEEEETEVGGEDRGPTPEEVITQLKAEIERKDEEAKRIKAQNAALEQEKSAAVASGATAQEQAVQAHETSIARAIDAENSRIGGLEQRLEAAQEAGNIKDMVAVQKELAKATVALANAENAKQNFDVWKQQQAEIAKQPKQQGYDPKVQRWIDEHPRFNTDDEYQAEVLAADVVATRMGYTMGTPAYFKFIEDRLDRTFAEDDKPAKTVRAKVIPSAAPTRDNQPSTNRQAKSWKDIELSPAQREAAEVAGVSEDDYKKGLVQHNSTRRS